MCILFDSSSWALMVDSCVNICVCACRDLVAIIAALEYNQWFTKVSAKDVRLVTLALTLTLPIRHSSSYTELCSASTPVSRAVDRRMRSDPEGGGSIRSAGRAGAGQRWTPKVRGQIGATGVVV